MKKTKIATICASVVIVGIASLLIAHSLTRASAQSDYPKLSAPASISFAGSPDTTLTQQVSNSKLVVDATVVKVLPDETRVFTPEKGSGEAKIYKKKGISSSTYTVRPVELKINDTLKGSSKSDTITMYLTPVEMDSSPDFKTYKHLVFMLSDYISGGYTPTTLQDGYYYISDDNKVYPAVNSNKLKTYSGVTVDDFKRDIKNIIH